MFGMAVSSSSPAVAARCAYARAWVGAVASQNVTDPTLGTKALDLMERGATADEAIAILARTQPHMAFRQVLAVDRTGGNGGAFRAQRFGHMGRSAGQRRCQWRQFVGP